MNMSHKECVFSCADSQPDLLVRVAGGEVGRPGA